jgi:hypothetical protein
MRVTGIIKDYITSEVDKKYQEKIKNIPNEYEKQYNKCVKELNELEKESNKKAIEIAKKYNMCEKENYNFFNLSVYHLGNDELEKPYLEEKRRLRQEKSDKIAQIILGLELGETNKKELTDILEKVEF